MYDFGGVRYAYLSSGLHSGYAVFAYTLYLRLPPMYPLYKCYHTRQYFRQERGKNRTEDACTTGAGNSLLCKNGMKTYVCDVGEEIPLTS